MMFNKAPIFVNGFQRGGTNILVNLLGSHPDVGVLRVETHEVFYGRESEMVHKWLNRILALPVFIAAGRYVFWPYRFYSRKELSRPLERYIDLLFYGSKLAASANREGLDAPPPRLREIARTRMLAKNVNGVAMTTDMLAKMYPKATFLALVRHGFAVCEGFVRRGWSPERIGRLYQQVGQKISDDAQVYDNYHIVRFEDMLTEPEPFIRKLYHLAGLELDHEALFRLQAKPSMDQEGRRTLTFGKNKREIQCFKIEELKSQFRQDVNQNQIDRLDDSQKRRFLEHSQSAMEHFGYC